jgi:hypothetical protein
MSVAALKPIALLGYEPPTVKAGEVRVPIRINGGLHELRGAPGVMRAFAGDVLGILAADPRTGRALNPNSARGRRAVEAARILQYRAAWRSYIGTPGRRISSYADELGMTEAALSRWFRKFRFEPGAPAVKPNGKL